jgi:hypothetical protein
MTLPRILVIGQDPDTVDFSAPALAGMSAEKVKAGIKLGEALMAQAGFTADHVLTDAGPNAVAVVSAALATQDYGVVIIGAGIRLQPPASGLFETVLATIMAHTPAAKIGFNQTPQDTVDAVKRLI